MKKNLIYYIHKAIWIIYFYITPFVLGYFIFQKMKPNTILSIILFLVVWFAICFILAFLVDLLLRKIRDKWETIDNHFLFIEKEDNKY